MTQKRVALLSEAFPSISRTINQASDSLNANIVEFEATLNRFRLGVTAEIVLNSGPVESDEPMTFVESLEYSKHKGRWGLWLAEYYEETVDSGDPNSYNLTPLKDAPRELRFQAVEKFPELLQRLAERGQAFADEAVEKSQRVADLNTTLKSIELLNI
jgi:hypothetical protein